MDGALKRLLVGLGGLGEAADLAHVLQRGGIDLISGNGRIEVVEDADVSAHGAQPTTLVVARTWVPSLGGPSRESEPLPK